jgi:hypothetical protein
MEKYKIEIFKKENSNDTFEFKTLSEFLSGKVIGLLLRHFGFKTMNVTNVDFFRNLETNIRNKIPYGSSGITKVQLENIFSNFRITDDSPIFLIWDLDTMIDYLTLRNLLKYFEYIWYDSSDEALVLFVPEAEFVVLLTDRGYLACSFKNEHHMLS